MEKYTLSDNTILNFIPIEAKRPIFGIQVPSALNTSIGSFNTLVPHVINSDYANFKCFFMEEGIDLSSYNNPTAMESWLEELFDAADSFRVATLFNGLQFLKIPINRFNDLTISPSVNNYGTYYIKVSPKYIETTITFIDIIPLPPIAGPYMEILTVLKAPFKTPLSLSLWNFEDANVALTNRLVGFVVEIWDSSLQVKKQSKIIFSDDYKNPYDISGLTSKIELSPTTCVGDFVQQTPAVGDKVRIYPKDSYFEPIFIEVSYQNNSNDLLEAIRYLKNDVTRDLVNNVIEVYDDAGATVNSQGTIDGVVIQSYQISKVNNKELRKKLII